MARAIGATKISLGFLRKANRDEYTQRTFEVPACGGMLLAERTPEHLRIYEEDREAVFFDPQRPDELCGKVRRLLQNDDERESIRRAGTAAVLRGGHTYRDRLERLLELHGRSGR
jgi:spore maturation protein CgeB